MFKCRGDGRTYKISLNSPLLFDVTWGDAHSYYLHTHGGPYWQYEAIPFSKFIHTVRNRIMDKQYPIKNINVRYKIKNYAVERKKLRIEK